MSTTYYRIHEADRNHADILDEANWRSVDYGDHFDDDVHHGVSACESIEELAAYIAQTGIEVTCPVLVEFEGDEADDEDHDVELGAVLTFPRSITAVHDDDDVWAEFDEALTAALGF